MVLDSDTRVPPLKVQVQAENGWLTLEGEVDTEFQKRAAEEAVRN